jgi:phospholipid/cholesterol/gamma-HCH transport system substrate-binding protein
MSKKNRNEVLVGAFITVAMLLFVLLLFLMGSLDNFLERTITVEVDFGDVQSLQVGDPVYLFGNKVGKVARIALLPPPADGKRAVVRTALRIPSSCRDYLREDSTVKIDKSLTGKVIVLIEEGDGKRLPDDARLKGTPVTDLASVTQRLNRVLDEGQKVVGSISRMVTEIESKGDATGAVAAAHDILKKVRDEVLPLGDRLRQTMELVQGMVEENRLDIRHTVVNLKETTSSAKTLTEGLASAPEQIQRSLAELERASGSVASLVRENRSNVDTILEDLRQTMTNSANLTAEVKRRPWRLLYRPSDSELKAMELYDAAWAYNLGATELNRSIRDLAARMETDPDGTKRPAELEEAKKQLAQSLRKHREAEEQFWGKLKATE